jgi:hypothetical protein
MHGCNTKALSREAPVSLVPSFVDLLQPLSAVMTAPSFQSFLTLITGWVFARRCTVTGLIMAAGAAEGHKHHSAYHRLFSAARWSLDELGLAVFGLILPLVPGVVLLAMDDTLARKRGLKVFGVGMHHDPLLSTRKTTVTNWGHCWVVLGVVLELPFCGERWFCLPVLFRLYVPKKTAEKKKLPYKTKPQLAVEMLKLLPRKRGQRLPTPKAMLSGRCRRLTLDIYGRKDKSRIAECTARVYAAPERPLKVVAVEPLSGGRKPQAFYSTCWQDTAEIVLRRYACRWSIEVTNHDAKGQLGFEQPQGWTKRAAQRTAPVAMLLYSLVVLWFSDEGHRHYEPPTRPWYIAKRDASFADMLATLRCQSVRTEVLSMHLHGSGSRNVLKLLLHVVRQAA